VSFENTHANKFVEKLSEFVLDHTKTSRKYIVLLRHFETLLEDDIIAGQRVLVHARNSGKTSHGKEKNGSTLSYISVVHTVSLNLDTSLFCYFEIVSNSH